MNSAPPRRMGGTERILWNGDIETIEDRRGARACIASISTTNIRNYFETNMIITQHCICLLASRHNYLPKGYL